MLYNTSLRRTIKRYHKIDVECLFGTILLNSLNQQDTEQKISITKFKLELIKNLKSPRYEKPQFPMTPSTRYSLHSHRFHKTQGKFDKIRKYCKECNAKHSKGEISNNKVKTVVSYSKD